MVTSREIKWKWGGFLPFCGLRSCLNFSLYQKLRTFCHLVEWGRLAFIDFLFFLEKRRGDVWKFVLLEMTPHFFITSSRFVGFFHTYVGFFPVCMRAPFPLEWVIFPCVCELSLGSSSLVWGDKCYSTKNEVNHVMNFYGWLARHERFWSSIPMT